MDINYESTKENVAEYLYSQYKISEEAKANILKESIDGVALFDLTQKEMIIFL